MQTNILKLRSNKVPKWFAIIASLVLIGYYIYFTTTSYSSWFAGYSSLKLIDSSGTTNSFLAIASQTSNSYLEVALGPRVSTTAATQAFVDGAGTHTTLNGTLDAIGLTSTVTVWFEWGYDTGYGNTTVTQSLAAPGTYSVTINHFDPGQPLHYRAVAQNMDGITYGDDQIGPTISGVGTSSMLLTYIVVVFGVIGLLVMILTLMGEISISTAVMVMTVGVLLGVILPLLVSILSSIR